MPSKILTLQETFIKDNLSFNTSTGVLSWTKGGRGRRGGVGAEAGYLNKSAGYRMVGCAGTDLLSHRIAWFLHHGVWPQDQIDHINHNRLDNRLINLQDVTHYLNQQNASQRTDNTSGVTGVNWHQRDRKWVVRIYIDGMRKQLGCYTDFFEACCARKSAEVKYKYHPNHGK